MSYKSDFENETGWSAVDTNVKLNTTQGKKFRDFIKAQGVTTVIRYYASTRRAKTLSQAEAKLLSVEGFNIIPVYQDRNRSAAEFGRTNGKQSAHNALEFAAYIGQPEGSTILFAVDSDFSNSEVTSHIAPYFQAIKTEINSKYRIGAYGGGNVLRALLDMQLIDVPWISMSRLFNGTEQFFYSNDWALRQVPPDRTHSPSSVTYDRNVLKWPIAKLGAFRIESDGLGIVVGADAQDGVLGGVVMRGGEAAIPLMGPTNAYVSTEGLNLRVQPRGDVIRSLTIGTPVHDMGVAADPDWQRVAVGGDTGVVHSKYLRQPSTPEIESLLQATVEQWVRFDKGRAHEATDPYYTYVGEMWQAIGLNYDGRSHYPNGEEVPWSAAFISFVVRRAGQAYADFKFHERHSAFAHDAIQARIMGITSKPFWGYRRTEQRPEVGDIVLRNRGGNNYSFDYAENHSQYLSHSDIVVEVTTHVARVIGGNVGDTVSMRSIVNGDNIQEYELNDDGYIRDGQRVIAILKNRAASVS